MDLENKKIIDFAEKNSFKASPQVLNTVINQNSLGGPDWSENDIQARGYIKNRTHWKEYEDRILIENEEATFEAVPDEDWETKGEKEKYLSVYLYPSANSIDFRNSDFEIAVDGNICNTKTVDRSSGFIKVETFLLSGEVMLFFFHEKPCGGGYAIDVNYYNNSSETFHITIKEKIPTYFPIDNNYLISKLSTLTVIIDADSNCINAPLNFCNGIIFAVKTNDNLVTAKTYYVQFGTDSYSDRPKNLLNLSNGNLISSTSILMPKCALIYVDNNQSCYLINPVQAATST